MGKIRVMLFIATLYIVLFIHTGTALNCYQCTENTSNDCKDHFEKKASQIVCPSDTVCVKHIQPAARLLASKTAQKNLTKNIIRGCKPKDYCNQVKEFSEFCQTCSNDLCNDSITMKPSLITSLIFGIYNVYHYF